mgnify:CR=1 FL=1
MGTAKTSFSGLRKGRPVMGRPFRCTPRMARSTVTAAVSEMANGDVISGLTEIEGARGDSGGEGDSGGCSSGVGDGC